MKLRQAHLTFIAMLGSALATSHAYGNSVTQQDDCQVTLSGKTLPEGKVVELKRQDRTRIAGEVDGDRSGNPTAILDGLCELDWVGSVYRVIGDLPQKSQDKALQRKKTQFELGLEIGYAIAPLAGGGVFAAYYLSEDNALEFSYAAGAYSEGGGLLRAEGDLTELRYKKFWSDSFYTNLGVGQRTIVLTSPLLESVFDYHGFHIENTTAVISLAIGNRWHLENLFFGGDWIGSTWGLNRGESKTGYEADPDDEYEKERREEMEESASAFAKVTTTQFLRLYLGYSF